MLNLPLVDDTVPHQVSRQVGWYLDLSFLRGPVLRRILGIAFPEMCSRLLGMLRIMTSGSCSCCSPCDFGMLSLVYWAHDVCVIVMVWQCLFAEPKIWKVWVGRQNN